MTLESGELRILGERWIRAVEDARKGKEGWTVTEEIRNRAREVVKWFADRYKDCWDESGEAKVEDEESEEGDVGVDER